MDTNFTYIEVVDTRNLYVEPLGYEITKEEIEGYAQAILEVDKDEEFDKFGIYHNLM